MRTLDIDWDRFEALLKFKGWEDYKTFARVVGCDESYAWRIIKQHKPFGAGILNALWRLGIRPDELLVTPDLLARKTSEPDSRKPRRRAIGI